MEKSDRGGTDRGNVLFPKKESTIPKFLREWCLRYEDHVALIAASREGERERLTYRKLGEIVNQLSGELFAMGLAKGDRIVLGGPNTIEWELFILAAASAGIVIVPLDTRSEHDFVRRVCEETGVKFAFLSSLDCPLAQTPLPQTMLMSELVAKSNKATPRMNDTVSPNDLYAIIYTSGTTSAPKGVMLTQGNIASNIDGLQKHLDLGPSHILLSVLPLAHILEQVCGFLATLSFGYTIIIPEDRQPDTLTALMKKYKTTAMMVVPYMLERMQETMTTTYRKKHLLSLVHLFGRLPFSIRRHALALLRGPHRTTRFMISAGAPLLRTTKLFWEGLGVTVLEGYGLTETSPVLTLETKRERRLGSAGKAIPGVSIRIADDGEILARGNSVFHGYFRNEVATRAVFENDWFKTGDMGELDRDGFLTIKGRKKYMLLDSRGINIYPEDVEAVLNAHHGVKDCCVITASDEGRIELTAVIVPKANSAIDLKAVKDEANARLGNHQQIVHLIIWDEPEFPKTLSLKNKRELIRAKIFG